MENTQKVEEAVGQYLRISRMLAAGDLSEGQAGRACRALAATLSPEQWEAVKLEGCSRELRAAGWKVASSR